MIIILWFVCVYAAWRKQEKKTPFFGNFTRPFLSHQVHTHTPSIFIHFIYDGFCGYTIYLNDGRHIHTHNNIQRTDNNHEIHDININTSINASSVVVHMWYVNISRTHHSISSQWFQISHTFNRCRLNTHTQTQSSHFHSVRKQRTRVCEWRLI